MWRGAWRRAAVLAVAGLSVGGLAVFAADQVQKAAKDWGIHDTTRPVPPVITPGTFSTPDAPGKAPSDAIVLFDGKDLSEWTNMKGEAAGWKVENGYFEAQPKGGDVRTKRSFGDVQVHLEWAAPSPAKGNDQGRGNSGLFLQERYEVQVLDCYQNKTYADGHAGAAYGQYPPMVNACLPPGQWQVYDVVFRAPRFAEDGKLLKPARLTVVHNGVVVQDAVPLTGPTVYRTRPPYQKHDKAPIRLQDHGNPVRFRNIWVRELPEVEELEPAVKK